MKRLAPIAIAAVVLAGCADSPAETSSVVLSDFAMVASPASLAAGEVVFEVENVGEVSHMMVVTDQDGAVLATTRAIDPGQRVTLEADLEPGRYLASCRIVVQLPSGEIIDHLEEGMSTTLRVAAKGP